MSDPVIQIMSLVGCTEEVARLAFQTHNDVVLAVDSLMVIPETSGSKYIPKKPEINRMMTQEQQDRCERGRKVSDTINAFQKSAYHSAKLQAESAEMEQSVEIPSVQEHEKSHAESS